MFACFYKPKDQKELYFSIDHALKLDLRETNKISGVYAIYKNESCLYVGQSKNLPSRIATHLCGKYKTATKILLFIDNECEDLIPSEKYLIQTLEPIENIIADYTETIPQEQIMLRLRNGYARGYLSLEEACVTSVIIDHTNIFIDNGQASMDLMENRKISDHLSLS